MLAELLRPKGKKNRNFALFPADNENMQIIEILKVLGTPDIKELKGNQKDIDNIIESWYSVGLDKQFPPIELSELFPTASKDGNNIKIKVFNQKFQLAVDLLKKMLEINPEKRISIEEALSHPYLLEEDEEEDDTTLKVFSYDFEDNLKYTSGDRQGKLKVQQYEYETTYNEIMDWNKKVNGFSGDGEIIKTVKIQDPELERYKKKHPNVQLQYESDE